MECVQRKLFLSEVNNRETITVIEVNNDAYCLQTRIEKFPLCLNLEIIKKKQQLQIDFSCRFVPHVRLIVF